MISDMIRHRAIRHAMECCQNTPAALFSALVEPFTKSTPKFPGAPECVRASPRHFAGGPREHGWDSSLPTWPAESPQPALTHSRALPWHLSSLGGRYIYTHVEHTSNDERVISSLSVFWSAWRPKRPSQPPILPRCGPCMFHGPRQPPGPPTRPQEEPKSRDPN